MLATPHHIMINVIKKAFANHCSIVTEFIAILLPNLRSVASDIIALEVAVLTALQISVKKITFPSQDISFPLLLVKRSIV